MKSIYAFLVIVLVGVVFNGCRKEDDGTAAPGSGQSGTNITTSFTGIVRDLQGNFMAGVQVSIGGKVVSTDGNGRYFIQNVEVSKSRSVLSAVKAGFWSQQKAIIPAANTVNYADMVLFPDNKSYTVNATSGGTITLSGGTIITFPANAFVTSSGIAYSGIVYLTAHEILTSENKFVRKAPGGDMLAIDNAGNQKLLLSYGMAGAKLYDASGNQLKLATGKQAEIHFPISATQSAAAPATIPLWHYDESVMMWKEEGVATRNGNYYDGMVTHFSWWNCDQPANYATLSMTFIDCIGQPLQWEEVDIVSPTFGTGYDFTDATGLCNGIVPANQVLTVEVYNYNTGTLDTTFTIGPFTTGSLNVNPPIQLQINCNSITGTLRDCNNAIINGTVVMLLNNQPISTTTTLNGAFSFPFNMLGQYTFVANSGQLTGVDSVTINGFNMGTQIQINMNLCDTVASGSNNFTLNFSSGSSVVNYSLNVTEAKFIHVNGYKQIVFTYEDSASGSVSDLTIGTPGYVPGAYSWNSFDSYVSGDLNYMGQTAQISSGSGSTQLISTPPVGGQIAGSFTGSVNLQVSGITVPGTLTATFDVTRTQ